MFSRERGDDKQTGRWNCLANLYSFAKYRRTQLIASFSRRMFDIALALYARVHVSLVLPLRSLINCKTDSKGRFGNYVDSSKWQKFHSTANIFVFFFFFFSVFNASIILLDFRPSEIRVYFHVNISSGNLNVLTIEPKSPTSKFTQNASSVRNLIWILASLDYNWNEISSQPHLIPATV